MDYSKLPRLNKIDKEIKNIELTICDIKESKFVTFSLRPPMGIYLVQLDTNELLDEITLAANQYHQKVIDILEARKAKLIEELENL